MPVEVIEAGIDKIKARLEIVKPRLLYQQPVVKVTASRVESPPLLLTKTLEDFVASTDPVVDGSDPRSCVFEPVPTCEIWVTRPPFSSHAVVPCELGGEPKLLPLMVMTWPQLRLAFGETLVIWGTGTTVEVGVAVGPAVFVATGVSVGVAVAPSGAKALKPEVMHGRRPSA